MRAISLWQPWASAIALGSKRIETRSWSTSYRGPLAIHAAKSWTNVQKLFAATEHTCFSGSSTRDQSDPLGGERTTTQPVGVAAGLCNIVCNFGGNHA